MRILMVITQYEPVIGGAERQAKAISESLVERGHQVTVLTQPFPGMPEEQNIRGVRVLRRLRAMAAGPLWGLTYMHSAQRELNRLAAESDIIHCHQFYFYTAIAGRLRGKGEAPPVVCKAINSSDITRMANRLGGKFLLGWSRNIDRVIATTAAIEQEALQHKFRPDQIARIPNFVDTEIFKPRAEHMPADEWLFLGRLHADKGPDLLLKAVALTRGAAKNALVLFVGDGPMKVDLMAKIRQFGLENRVRFVGSTNDPAAVISKARGVILPSRSEGLSNVLLEALACGKPVIATDVGGTREVLEGDQPLPHNALAKGFAFTRYGILVHPFDEESLALAIDEAEKNYEIMCEYARSAPGMLADKYSKDRVLDKLEGLYLELTLPK